MLCMFSSPKELIESAERIFVSDEEFVFVFGVERDFDIGGSVKSGDAVQRSRDSKFEFRDDGDFVERYWSVVGDVNLSYLESSDEYEELSGGVGAVVSRVL